MSERQDGWYCVRWPHMPDSSGGPIVPGPWRPAAYDSANDEWIDQGLHRRQPPLVIGQRISMPDDPPAPQAAVDLANFPNIQGLLQGCVLAETSPQWDGLRAEVRGVLNALESLRARVALLESK